MNSEFKKKVLIAGAGVACASIALAALAATGLWYLSRPKPPKRWNTDAIKARFDFVDTEGERNSVVFFYIVENMSRADWKVSGSPDLSVAVKLGQQKSLVMDREQKDVRLDYPIFVPAGQRVRLAVHLILNAQPNVKGMVKDPDFVALTPADQRKALQSLSNDKSFGDLSDADTQSFVKSLRSSTLLVLEYSYTYQDVIDNAIRGTPKGTEDEWSKYVVPPPLGHDTPKQHRERVKAYVGEQLANLDGFVLFDELHRYQIDFPRDW